MKFCIILAVWERYSI